MSPNAGQPVSGDIVLCGNSGAGVSFLQACTCHKRFAEPVQQTDRVVRHLLRNAERPQSVYGIVRFKRKAVVVTDIVQRARERVPVDGAAKHGRNVIVVLPVVVVDMQRFQPFAEPRHVRVHVA